MQVRVRSIDFVRGLVMVIMALDHIRDLFHIDSLSFDPTDLSATSPLLFFTRWITHLCAPTFVFLSGVSAYLSAKRENDPVKSSRFLISRGLWLIVLEFTLVNFGIWFDIHFQVFLSQVIAAIGCGFVILGLMHRVPSNVVGLTGLLIICLYPLFSMLQLDNFPVLKTILNPLFMPGAIPLTAKTTLIMGYPPLPWIAIILAGYGLGKYMTRTPQKRKRLFCTLGIAALSLFIILRLINGYGNPLPWAIQKDQLFTFLSFINVTKYPPSPLYDLLMLGIMFLLLTFAETKDSRFLRAIEIYGKVPLFFYLIHWYLIHMLLLLLLYAQGFHLADFRFGFRFGRPEQSSGLALWAVYLTWLSVVLLLYPLCRWYGRYKFSHKEKTWLKYL